MITLYTKNRYKKTIAVIVANYAVANLTENVEK